MDNENLQLEKYKVINNIIIGEIKEFYTLNSIFLLVNGGFITASSITQIKSLPIIIFGIINSFLWLFANCKHHKWKGYWIERGREIEEKELLGLDIWKGTDVIKKFEILPLSIAIRLLPILFILFYIYLII